MKQMLFVDDDTSVLSGLRRMLRPMRREWHMHFVDSGENALAALDQIGIDIVVSDMQMPVMDGARLLDAVMEKWPDTVRIILSGYSDPEMAMRAVTAAHQYLPKPCDEDMLLETLKRACRLSNILKNNRIKSFVAGMSSIPSLPNLYMEILKLLKSEDASIQKIGEVVGQDIGMTAKILQLINSAFFGLPRQVPSVSEAVCLLGVDIVKALVLSIKVFSQFDPAVINRLKLENIWPHSLRVGHLARKIALDAGAEARCADQALMAGNLHDLGKIILAVNYPEKYSAFFERAQQDNDATGISIEQDVFEVSHPEIGAYLLGLWGLPDGIVEAVAHHHQPRATGTSMFSPVVAVHVANALINERSKPSVLADTDLDISLLQSLDDFELADRLDHWRAGIDDAERNS